MRPAIIIIDSSISFTGAFKCALAEADLLKDDLEFIFVLPRGSKLIDVTEKAGFKTYTLPMVEINRSFRNLVLYFPRLILNAVRLARIAREHKASFIQVNDFYNLLGAMLKIRGYKGKLITYVRFLPNAMPVSLRKLWTRAAQKYSHSVVAVSDAVLNQLPEKKNTVRLYDAVEFSEQYPQKEHTGAGTKLLYLANYIRGKGHNHALGAFSIASRENKNITLRFAGGDMGLEKNRQFRKELEEKTQQLQLGDRVSFSDFASDVENAIKEADILLNFSEAESFSMTCAEASYYGTPVIATRCGGPEEIVQHNETGILVPNRDVNAMATAIQELAASPQLQNTFSRQGRAYVREKFSSRQFRAGFLRLLQTE